MPSGVLLREVSIRPSTIEVLPTLTQTSGSGYLKRAAKNPTQQGGYVETKLPTYPREGRCVGRCVEPA